MKFLELAGLPVLPDIIPGKVAAVHRYIDPWREGLGKGECAAQVEKPVRAPEFVGDHGAGQDDGLARYFLGQDPGCYVHGVGAVGNDKFVFRCRTALMGDQFAIFVAHMEAVDHHQCSYGHVEGVAAALQHFGEVGLFKEQFACQFIIFFIEGSPGYKYSYGAHAANIRLCGKYAGGWKNGPPKKDEPGRDLFNIFIALCDHYSYS
jgi:hypothetical protein